MRLSLKRKRVGHCGVTPILSATGINIRGRLPLVWDRSAAAFWRRVVMTTRGGKNGLTFQTFPKMNKDTYILK